MTGAVISPELPLHLTWSRGCAQLLIQIPRARIEAMLAELAEAYYLTQKFDESIKWARRALQAKPGLPIANYYLMASYIETNQNLSEAERILADLETLRPGDQALAEIRQLIQKAKLDGGKSKSVLAHGPESETGGRR